MADPIGENTYKGLAVPLYGESLLLQQNSSNAIWTFQHSSANEGRFLAGRNHSYSTVLGDADQYSSVLTSLVWDIDADGGYRAVSGETILMELNSSGIEGRAGTTLSWGIDSSGRTVGMKQNVVVVTTGTNFTIETSLSGSLLALTSASGTSMAFILPANAPVGTWYDFFLTSQADVGDVKITSTAGTGRIHMTGTPSSVVSSVDCITPASTVIHLITLTVIETDVWVATRKGGMNYSSAGTTDYTRVDLDLNSWTSAAILA